MEYFRAQPIASFRREVKNDVSPDISLPLKGAVVPNVNEAHHQHSKKDPHLYQPGRPKRAIYHGPRVKKDEFDIEQDKENRGEIKLDSQPPDRQGKRFLAALERRQFGGGRILLPQRRAEEDHESRDACSQHKTDGN